MLFFRLLALLPFSFLYRLSDALAFALDRGIRYRRRVIEENLRASFPEKTDAQIVALRRGFYRNFTDTWLETIKLLALTPAELKERIRFEQEELMLTELQKGKSPLVLCGHLSNWEWLLQGSVVLLNLTADAAYQKVNSAFFNKLMFAIRSRSGAHLIERNVLLRESIRRRKLQRVLAMVADQRPQKRHGIHYWTTFLNRPAPFFDAAEKLATKAAMPVFYVDIRREGRGYYCIHFTKLSENAAQTAPEEITESFVRQLEAAIRRAPSDYLWSHKRWKHRPPEAKG